MTWRCKTCKLVFISVIFPIFMHFLSFHGFCAHPVYIFSFFFFSLTGIRLTLNIEKELYWDLISPEYGVRILVHPQGTLPTLQKGGIILNPGKSVHIGIKRVSHSTVIHKLVRILELKLKQQMPEKVFFPTLVLYVLEIGNLSSQIWI